MNTLSLKESNDKIIELLQSNKPFYISRIGLGAETMVSYTYIMTKNINHPAFKNLVPILHNNNGIYIDNNANLLKIYCELYFKAVKESDYLAAFKNAVVKEQNLMKPNNKELLYSRILEPFYCYEEDNIKPWSHYLINKKVLIISPFVDSFKKQINNNFQIYKDPDKKIFLDNQEFIYYKCFNNNGFNKSHKNWLETLNVMCEDIKKIDFDVALLGCGGYGMPLCYFIKNVLNKSSLYVGGGLQLLFGVMGKRWENNDMWKKIIKENQSKFIRPSGEEIIKNNNNIEDGCYW